VRGREASVGLDVAGLVGVGDVVPWIWRPKLIRATPSSVCKPC